MGDNGAYEPKSGGCKWEHARETYQSHEMLLASEQSSLEFFQRRATLSRVSTLAKSRARALDVSALRLDQHRASLQCECYEVSDGRSPCRPARETLTLRLDACAARAKHCAARANRCA